MLFVCILHGIKKKSDIYLFRKLRKFKFNFRKQSVCSSAGDTFFSSDFYPFLFGSSYSCTIYQNKCFSTRTCILTVWYNLFNLILNSQYTDIFIIHAKGLIHSASNLYAMIHSPIFCSSYIPTQSTKINFSLHDFFHGSV